MNDKTDTPQGKPASKDVSVTLKKAHRHRGDFYGEGDSIRCRPDTAEWLKAKGIARAE